MGLNSAIIAGAKAYIDTAVTASYVGSKYSVLHDPNKFEYSLFGEGVMIREVTGGNASDYDEDAGFEVKGDTGSVEWNEYKAFFDRQHVAPVAAMKEYNSLINGNQKLSGVLKLEAFYKNYCAEIDAVACSTIFNNTPVGNVFTDATYALDAANVIETFSAMDQKIKDAGEEGLVYAFIGTDVEAVLRTALIKQYGLANSAVLTIENGELKLNLTLTRFGDRMIVVGVPTARMHSHIILKDGKSVGQESGGWVADTTNADYKKVRAQFVPADAAAVSIRHIVSNITLPASYFKESDLEGIDLGDINEIFNGQAIVKNIGIDQQSDQFKYMNRIKGGVPVFKVKKSTIFAITAAV